MLGQKAKDKIYPHYKSFSFGAGINFIDNDNQPMTILKIKDHWNMAWYPSVFEVEKGLSKYFKLNATFSINRYQLSKIVEDAPLLVEYNYVGFDLKAKYLLSSLYGYTPRFDAFISVGGGYDIEKAKVLTGFGFYSWINNIWGVKFETTVKWGVAAVTDNILQHSFTVMYRLKESQNSKTFRIIKRKIRYKF